MVDVLRCGRCGRKMQVAYSGTGGKVRRYACSRGRDMHATGITPHMHLLGREMKVTATYPDGTVRPLVYIDDWDFHWQANYTFEEPVPLPSGTITLATSTISARGHEPVV